MCRCLLLKLLTFNDNQPKCLLCIQPGSKMNKIGKLRLTCHWDAFFYAFWTPFELLYHIKQEACIFIFVHKLYIYIKVLLLLVYVHIFILKNIKYLPWFNSCSTDRSYITSNLLSEKMFRNLWLEKYISHTKSIKYYYCMHLS